MLIGNPKYMSPSSLAASKTASSSTAAPISTASESSSTRCSSACAFASETPQATSETPHPAAPRAVFREASADDNWPARLGSSDLLRG